MFHNKKSLMLVYAFINSILTILSCFSLTLYATQVENLNELVAFLLSFVVGIGGFLLLSYATHSVFEHST